MFGLGETFYYSECAHCGTLQLLDVPADLSAYYPPGYYSFAPPLGPDRVAKRLVKAGRALFLLHAPAPLLGLVPRRLRPTWADWFRGNVRSLNAPIVDVGSGSGALLSALYNNGFTNLTGYDPFIPEGQQAGPIAMHREFPVSLRGQARLVMLHHSLEHVTDPAAALGDAAGLLAPGASVVVRVPLADSFAWRHYRTDWVQLDPPRHVFAFTEHAVELVAAAAGLRVVERWRDSADWGLWGSEQLRRGIFFHAEGSALLDRRGSTFAADELREFERRAAELNARGEGDSGCFLLKRIEDR